MAKQLSCGVEFMRGLLLFLNILFVIVGIALIGVGIYIKVDTKFASFLSDLASQSEFSGQSLGFLAYMMIGAGVVTLLIALFGCVGTLWHNRCLLYMYAFVLVGLMILELVGFIMAFVYKGKLQEVYEEGLLKAFKDGVGNEKQAIIDLFQSIENSLSCCGVNNVTDYQTYGNVTYDRLSKACKKDPPVSGCAQAIIDILDKNLPAIGGTLGGILLLELVTLIGSIVLAVALKHAPDDQYSSRPGDVLGSLVPGRGRRHY